MLSHVLRQIINSFGIFFRTIRAFFTRRLTAVWARLRGFANFSRYATKVASDSFQGAASAMKKPTRKEDYIETSRLYISKSFLILLLAGLAAAGLFVYLVGWPFIVSRFLTAHFYQQDEKLADWSGRVVVYYDEEKTQPQYSGTLAEGVLQGRGKEYDLDGMITYDGEFVDGLHDGKGTQYEAGLLIYQGRFQNGLYEGAGELYEGGQLVYSGSFAAGEFNGLGTAYRDGKECYKGMFVSGQYNGEGTSYYPSGATEYKGAFSQGLREGSGVLYFENGARAYSGAFAADLREGEGTAYREDGGVVYKGSFSQDLYEGTGSLYLENGDIVQAEFLAGATDGSIRWYKGGKLWYDGEAEDITPHGFGRIYAKDGKAIYEGQMEGGTLDGAWLLSLTSEEFRTACGDAVVTELDRGTGFVIQNETLGLSALCSFQQEEQESAVYQLWFQPVEVNAGLLPWSDAVQARDWATAGRELLEEEKTTQGQAERPDGSMSGNWQQFVYGYETYHCTLLCGGKREPPAQIIWSRKWNAGSSGGFGSEGSGAGRSPLSQAQTRLEGLTEALDNIGGGSGGTVNRGDVERLLGLMLTAEDAKGLTDSLVDFLVNQKAVEALEANQPLLEQLLTDAQAALERGTGTEAAVENAQDELDALDLQLAQYKNSREQARTEVKKWTTLDPEDYELQPVLVLFDPVEVDTAALYDAALEYAKGVAAGRYVADTNALENQMRAYLLSLSSLYESYRTAQARLDRLEESLQKQTEGYAKGRVSKSALYGAQCTLSEAVAAVYQTMGNFTKIANQLNGLSGGWVAEEYDWLPGAYGAIFRGERARGEEAAAALEEERRQREEEAAQAIQGQTDSPDPNETAAPPQE